VVSAKGVRFTTEDGRKRLDFSSCFVNHNIGHQDPRVIAAITEQAKTLCGFAPSISNKPRALLAKMLAEVTPGDLSRAFISTGGTEANEAALKMARLYGHQKGIDTPQVIVTEGSFHGRTMATLTATGNRKIQAGFEPLVPGFLRSPYDDLDAIRTIAQNRPNSVAVLVEPITGEGGIRIPDENYLVELRALCDEHGWLMILDEIQTGMGRTGRWFAHQHADVKPDIMTLAKGLANGVPVGACLASGAAADIFKPGNHGSTFGGNPLSASAALAVLHTLERDGLVERAGQLGNHLLEHFEQRLGGLEGVVSIRGKGLMLGIELDRACSELVQQALQRKLLINVTAEKVVRLLPPLILSDEQAGEIASTVCELIETFLSEE